MKPCLALIACLVAAAAPACRSSRSAVGSRGGSVELAGADATVILVRHASKGTSETDPRDPPLDGVGVEQARLLARMTRDAGVDRVIISNFRRTRETAAPVAAMNPGVSVNASGDFNASSTVSEIATTIREAATPGRTVLVVAHSNQIPGILGELGGWRVPALTESDYALVFIVTLRSDGSHTLIRAGYAPSAD